MPPVLLELGGLCLLIGLGLMFFFATTRKRSGE